MTPEVWVSLLGASLLALSFAWRRKRLVSRIDKGAVANGRPLSRWSRCTMFQTIPGLGLMATVGPWADRFIGGPALLISGIALLGGALLVLTGITFIQLKWVVPKWAREP